MLEELTQVLVEHLTTDSTYFRLRLPNLVHLGRGLKRVPSSPASRTVNPLSATLRLVITSHHIPLAATQAVGRPTHVVIEHPTALPYAHYWDIELPLGTLSLMPA